MTICSNSVVADEPAAAIEFISWAALIIWATSSGFISGASAFVFGVVDDIGVLDVVVEMVTTLLPAFSDVEEVGGYITEEGDVLFRNRDTQLM